jgi:hypothetical protein
MTDNTNTNGGVRTTSVKFTASGKPFGADVFISIESVHEFSNLADDEEVLARQEELSVQLQAQVIDLIKQASQNTREAAANTPKGAVSIYPANGVNSIPATQINQVAPAGTNAQAVVAVANGAVQSQGDWRSVPSRFGEGQVRFISSQAYPTDKLKSDILSWISSQGINADLFDIWDERIGPRGAEAGNPIGSVFNIKVKKEAHSRVPDDFHRNAAGRGKFNNDGSLYIYWVKEFDSYLKYVGKTQLV